MRVLIIEDEEIAAAKLNVQIKRYDPNITIVDSLDSIKRSIEWLNTHPLPDLIFLDIHLSDGLSFEIFKKVHVNVPIVFTTAYNEFAIKAFELNSIDYLLKPIKPEDIARSLDKYKAITHRFQNNTQNIDFEKLISLVSNKQKTYKERFLVKVGQKITAIPTTEIAYFCAEEKIVLLITHTNRKIPVDYSLDQLTELLNPNDWFKANRQYLIRFEAITGMYPYSSSRIKVTLNPAETKELIVSSDRVSVFKKWLDR